MDPVKAVDSLIVVFAFSVKTNLSLVDQGEKNNVVSVESACFYVVTMPCQPPKKQPVLVATLPQLP